MKKFTDEFTNQFENRELQPDEYLNESDHLIYCTKCHTPRQGRYTLQGRVFMPPIRCKCQQEIYDQEEARRKLSEKQAEIDQIRMRCIAEISRTELPEGLEQTAFLKEKKKELEKSVTVLDLQKEKCHQL